MTILVTGAAGFIGAYVSKALIESGETVIGIDSMNDYYDVSLKKDRLKHVIPEGEFTFIEMDIADFNLLKDVFQTNKITQVVEVLGNALSVTAEKNYKDMQPGDVKETYANIDAINKAVGYKHRCWHA